MTPRIWARYLNEAILLFGDRADVAFASHHWPTWGHGKVIRFLSEQRDLYAYLHDQSLRMLNQGYTGLEIAEQIQLPPALERAWHARGYYGSVSHDVKAIYQRYMGWFDGNPASLWKHPPEDAARRYVDCLWGTDAVVAKAGEYAENGTWRNFYLMGALELRHGAVPPSLSLASPDMIQALTVDQLFD